MNKKIIIAVSILLLIVTSIRCDTANSKTISVSGTVLTDNFKTDTECNSYVLMEANTDIIVTGRNINERFAPASITKVMSLILIYEALDNEQITFDDVVTVSDHAASMGGSQIFLESGEQMKVRDLVKSIIISSANDACTAMAEYIGGTEESFVEMMNQKASELGLLNTHFVNCCGLDAENHYSSAYDIAVMSSYLLKTYPRVQEYSLTWMDIIVHKTQKGEKEFVLTNTNKLLKTYRGITGLKTGSTGDSGYSLSATADRDGTFFVAVVLGAKTTKDRFSLATNLLDYGFANYKVISFEPDEISYNIDMNGFVKKQYKFKPENTVYLLVPTDVNKSDISFEMADKITENGLDYVVNCILSIDDEEIIEVPLFNTEIIERITFKYCFLELIKCI